MAAFEIDAKSSARTANEKTTSEPQVQSQLDLRALELKLAKERIARQEAELQQAHETRKRADARAEEMRLRVGQLQQVQQRVDPTAAAERKRMQQAAVAAQEVDSVCLDTRTTPAQKGHILTSIVIRRLTALGRQALTPQDIAFLEIVLGEMATRRRADLNASLMGSIVKDAGAEPLGPRLPVVMAQCEVAGVVVNDFSGKQLSATLEGR